MNTKTNNSFWFRNLRHIKEEGWIAIWRKLRILIRPPALFLLRIFGHIFTFILLIIKPFKYVKILLLQSSRIGHLTANTDWFLRKQQLLPAERRKRITYLGISGTPCNRQLLKMYKRKIRIIESNTLNYIFISVKKSKFIYDLLPEFHPNAYYEFNNTEVNLHFTPEEETKGQELLKKMGINKDDWFICFHSREPTYLERKFQNTDYSYHSFRDCSIKNYLKAAEFIASKGGYAIRMGSEVAEKLPDNLNPRIIDYATNFRTDFGDIYLPAKCKFFVGSSAGLICVSYIFHVPIAMANYTPINVPSSPRKGDLFIPMKIWSKHSTRFLKFREILDSEVGGFLRTEQYEQNGLVPIENSDEEILSLTKEIYANTCSSYKYSDEDITLLTKFRSIYPLNHQAYNSPANIGIDFLRKNRELLE